MTDNARFDASQYAFFGKDVVEEVELGGLEDSDNDVGPTENDEEFQLSSFVNREENEGIRSLAEIDDISSTFSKINKAVTDPRNAGIIQGRGGSFSREGSTSADWSQEPEFLNWSEQGRLDTESFPKGKRWWSQTYAPPAYDEELRALTRASSYPQQAEQLLDNCNDPVLLPKTSFISIPLDSTSQALPNLTRHSSIPSHNGGLQFPVPASSPTNLPAQLQLAGNSRGHRGVTSHFTPPSAPNNNWLHNQWPNQPNFFPGDHHNVPPNLLPNQLPRSNGLMNSQMILQQQQILHPLRPPLSHFSHLPNRSFNSDLSALQMMNNTVCGPDVMDQRLKAALRGRHNRLSQQAVNSTVQRYDGGWLQFRSKYMSTEEIENIVRMQHAATHSNDPYVDDYYHQACRAKHSAGSRLGHLFCPVNINETFSSARANKEAHAYLKIDALGRLSFSSIRRPRPLLEVDPPSASDDNNTEPRSSSKTLDEEPMLAARITIEDGLCLLLDVDDIDRFLQFNQPQDGGSELKQRRQVLLEGLAASLQLADPLGPPKTGSYTGVTSNDDLVFLRIISLPKGRKLLTRFLQLLFPGSELTRIVCMSIFRHLRFLFGSLPSDSCTAETTRSLARVVSSCIHRMDLSALSACFASIVCSSEKPPLRPIGSSGDGASVVIKSVLDQATELLSDSHAASSYNMTNRSLWQHSFNSFFALLIEYITRKYDDIVQSLRMQASVPVSIGAEAAKAISKEMPVDLLRACLPHTDEHQRKILLDFAQRTVPVATSGSTGQVRSESGPG